MATSAKEAILNDLKALHYIEEDVATSRRTLARLRKERVDIKTRFGKLLIKKTFATINGNKDFTMQNPLAMLYIAMQRSPRFARYVRLALAKHGAPTVDHPWSIAVYVDEVTCGQPLAVKQDARRKVQGVYWSLYQLGSQALADESCWFELAAFRTSETEKFVGSASQLLNVALSCFFDPAGVDARAGILFDLLDHGSLMVCLNVEMLIADVKAIVEAIGANGVSAHLPCWYCRKVLSFRALQNEQFKSLPGFVDLTCIDQKKWGKHTDRSLLKQLDELELACTSLSTGEYKTKVTLAGYKHTPHNFLRNPHLIRQPIRCISLDWMHLFFQTGNWNRETFQVFQEGTTRSCAAYKLFKEHVDAYCFPHYHKKVLSLLSDAHWNSCKEAGIFKCTASDGLSLYAVVGRFFMQILLPLHEHTDKHASLSAKVCSYLRLCDVVDVLQANKFGREVDPDLLDTRIVDWRNKHFEAYGATLTYLKTHLTGHLADNTRNRFEQSGTTLQLACWTLERHHRVIRKHVTDKLNTTNLELILAEELAIQSLRDLEQQPIADGFVNAHDASSTMKCVLHRAMGCSMHGMRTCVEARSGAILVHRGDVAIYHFDGIDFLAGNVVFFASASEFEDSAFIVAWEKLDSCEPGFWKFKILDDLVRVPIRNICGVSIAHIGATTATVVCAPAFSVA